MDHEPIKIDQHAPAKGILYGLLFTLVGLAIIYFVPRIVIALSDAIISTGISEVWIGHLVFLFIGILIGVVCTCTWLDIRCKYCAPILDEDAETERNLGKKVLAAMERGNDDHHT